ncbi:hypothetical protein PoB_001261900 [Plakobranchus ocellatus]|uniref:Uncharacterized protein n=1 Tax=Plakobranchus ocellatus TaxID=259542 RepID=A0AAV3YSR9_9GAST|nr:hypothetical protein PoB_001261900 [Plakobranchus ocellatus]
MRISWTERKTNEVESQLVKLVRMKRSLIRTIGEKQCKFLAHFSRNNRLEKITICGKIGGERSRSRRRTSHTDSLNAFETKKQKPSTRFIQLTDDRVERRTMIVNVCTRPDI